MTLRQKFGVLLGLLGLAVACCLLTAWWGVRLIGEHTERAFSGTSRVFTVLEGIDAAATVLSQGAGPHDHSPDDIAAARSALRGHIESLASDATFQSRVGLGAGEELRRAGTMLVHLTAPDPPPATLTDTFAPASESVTATAERVARLSGLVRSRLLSDAEVSAEASEEIAARVAWLLALALGGSALLALLAWFLLRRWVERPVAALREAAAKIGSGDLDHRVQAHGSDELARLAREVNHMASTIRSMQDERVGRERLAAVGELVRRMAHNLRNPLAGIRGVAEVTHDELPSESSLREGQKRIISSVDRFESWLKELLDETSPIDIVPRASEVRPFLRGVIEAHVPMAQSRGIDLLLDDAQAPTTAAFDPRHLEHALVALVTNALEATPRGGLVELSARSGNNGHWTLLVQDSGPGFSSDLLGRAFVSHFTTKPGGHGIGLAVASHVVRAHGGTLTVSNRDRTPSGLGGASFVIRLPLAAGATVSASEPAVHGEDPGH